MKPKDIVMTTILVLLQSCPCLWAQPTAKDEGEAKWQSRFPRDSELYVPEPILQREQSMGLLMTPSKSQGVFYDVRTGEEMILEAGSGDLLTESCTQGDVGIGTEAAEDECLLKEFTDLSNIANPELYPWRVNCKLFYKKGDSPRVASGILIDPLHVLTAGHCVHEGSGGNWVTDMVVVPAYDDGSGPYGDAAGVGYYAWTGWKRFGNKDDDIGIVKLDRPIGARTGWHGYCYNDDPLFYTENTFHNAGYPAGHPYDGRYMYYWTGNFDRTDYSESQGRWLGNEVGISRGSYGGQSGSAAYHINGSNYCAYGVLSNEVLGVTYYPRITGSKFRDIQNFIEDNTPLEFDLLPVAVRISPEGTVAGDRLSSMSYVVHNYSAASWSGRVDVSVYLSTNDNVSTSDTLIDRHDFTYSFQPKSSVTVDVSSPPVIPMGTATRNYWVGVILDISDHDSSNNDSDGQAAAPIVVGVRKLRNNTPGTFSAIPEEFAFDVSDHDWCIIGIRSSSDHDLSVGDNPDSGPWYAHSHEEGAVSDFVVINGRDQGSPIRYAQVHKGSSGPYSMEAQWDILDLSIGEPKSDSMTGSELHQMYEVLLSENMEYRLTLDVISGNADLAVYVFKPTFAWGSRTYTDWTANNTRAGRDESLVFTADSTGYHAIAVINENAASANYSINVVENASLLSPISMAGAELTRVH